MRFIALPPSKNTCPYVAMSLLLTYYDTYWHDDFVPDQYERSDGETISLDWQAGTYDAANDTLIETFAATVEAQDWKNYINSLSLPDNTETYPYYPLYAMAKADDFLEPYLISFGRHLGYHSLTDTKLGLSDSETVDVLEYYLYNVCKFTSAQITVKYLHEDNGDIEAKMREVIDGGFPVIYIGKNGESTNNNSDQIDNVGSDEKDKKDENDIVGHELIAFGYDESGDIKLHTGWERYNPVTTISSTDYKYNRAIIWLEINENTLSHECSDNYVDSVTGEELCACQIYESHPNHSSNHYYVQNLDHRKHWQECCCGDIIEEESHNYSYTYYNAIQHKATCDDCNYVIIPTHTYVEKANASMRWKECACGDYKFLHYHDFEYINYSESEHLLRCTDCDYETLASHEYSNYNDGNKLWQECICENTVINHYHSFEYIYNSENDHVASCTICPYAINITHDYAPKSISLTQHQDKCVCGDTIGEAENHYEAEYHSVSNFMHGVHCECGQLIHTENHSMTTVGLNNVCTDCGFVTNAFTGGITIKGKEDELDICTE